MAFARDDMSFATFNRRLATSGLGRALARRARLAHFCYGRSRWFVRSAWPLLGLVGRYPAWGEARMVR